MIEKLDLTKINNATDEFDFNQAKKECFVDLSVEVERPEILLSIGEYEYKGNHYPTPIMTSGEFSAITAASKSKKSFLKSALLGCYVGGNSSELFPNIRSHRNKDYSILDFDTEQGKFYSQRTFRRVHDISGGLYKHYYGYATRHLKGEHKLKLIDELLKNQKEEFEAPVKLVAIDGIADLIDNTNDIIMSREVSDYIMRWTHEYDLHITTVIHKSPTTGKPLGHLGTYVLKKAETVIELDKEENGTIRVTNPYSRGYRFDEFYFDVNTDALPYLTENNFI